jgi:MFS family permease
MAGLTLSGLILSVLAWPFLFYINVPIGIFGTVWALKRLKDPGRPERTAPMDWAGFAVFTVFISLLLLALTYAAYGMADAWFVAVLSMASAVLLVVFVRLEVHKEHPLLDLRLLRIREFTGGIITQLLNSIAWSAFLLVISLYLQLVQGYTALQAGLAIVPFDIAFVVAGPLSGTLSDKYGTRPFTTAGLLVISIDLLLFSGSGLTTPYTTVALYLIVGGAGMGLFVSPNMSSIMGSVPVQRRAVASALRATFFNVGYTLSLNLVILLMTFTIPLAQITQILTSLTPSTLLVDRAAFVTAIDRVYLVMAVLNFIAIVPSVLRGKRLIARIEEPAGRTQELEGD